MPRVIFIRRARSAREIGWCSRIRFRAIRRLISRDVLRVATRKSRVLILRIRLAFCSKCGQYPRTGKVSSLFLSEDSFAEAFAHRLGMKSVPLAVADGYFGSHAPLLQLVLTSALILAISILRELDRKVRLCASVTVPL